MWLELYVNNRNRAIGDRKIELMRDFRMFRNPWVRTLQSYAKLFRDPLLSLVGSARTIHITDTGNHRFVNFIF